MFMNSMFTKIVRILLGVILVLFGLNKLLPSPFIPLPEMPDKAASFMNSLGATGSYHRCRWIQENYPRGLMLVLY